MAFITWSTEGRYTASKSTIGPDAYKFEIDNYVDGLNTYNHEKYQTQLFKLELTPFIQILVAGSSSTPSTVRIKNISVWTSRGLASTFTVDTAAPSDGGFGGV